MSESNKDGYNGIETVSLDSFRLFGKFIAGPRISQSSVGIIDLISASFND